MPERSLDEVDRPVARSRGRPPLSASDIATRRARIIDVAARLFFQQGFAATGLEAIGRQAGVTKRTIYELIGDKPALFRAACSVLHAQGPIFAFDVPVKGRTAREVLTDMARQLTAHALDPQLIRLERAIVIEAAHSPQIVSDVIVEGKTNLDRAIGGIFDELVAEGRIPALDTLAAASIFYDAVVGARGFRAVFGHPDESVREPDIAARIDMFLYGYIGRHDDRDRDDT